MKRQFTFALATAAILAANAADYTVYNNGEIAAGLAAYGWYASGMDFTAADPAGTDTKVYSFKADNDGPAASMGLYDDGNVMKTGPLHSATLNFKWYASATATYTVRLTVNGGVEENYTWNVEESDLNAWHTMALPIATTFPQVSQGWNDYAAKGSGYIFAIVMENGASGATIYFDNIYYSNVDEDWKAPELPEIVPPTSVPAITQDKADVFSVFSAYGNVPYNIGGWGQATQCENVTLDGGEAVRLTNFNYLGWEFGANAFDISDYDYMSVSFYPCEETSFGFTPISPGQEKGWIAPEVKLNEWNTYNVPLSYFSNVNLKDIFQIKFDQGKFVEGYLANVYFYKDDSETPGPVDPVEPGATFKGQASGSYEQNMGEPKQYPYTMEYTIVYNEDKTLTITADFVWSDGEPVGMIPGSIFINNVLNDFTLTDGVRTVTTAATYEAGDTVNMNIYIPVALGVFELPFNYVVGSSNIEVLTEMVNAEEAAPVFYNLQGVRVANPEHGLYIRVAGNKAVKVRI